MKAVLCEVCGSKMKRNGHTKSGSQRWGCNTCGGSSTRKYQSDERDLKGFLDWLLSRERQLDMPGQGRTFRRKTARFWDIWPMPSVVDEIHRVIYVDGIYLSRDVCILIACSDSHVLSWYLSRSETSHAWIVLLSNIAPPDMVVTDGGSGFAKAVKQVWSDTDV